MNQLAGNMTAVNIEMLPPNPVYWRFAVEKRGGNLYFHQVKLSSADNGPSAMRKLRAEYQNVIHKAPYRLWDRVPFLWHPVIETATLSTNSATDLESQQDTRVFVARRKYHDDLTAAFHEPEILSNASDFVKGNDQFSTGGRDRKILLIRAKLSSLGVLLVLCLNIALCLGAGVLAGILAGSVDLGVSVSSAVIALVACLGALMALFWK